jgi:8-oxo-dGTP diphosphatase
MSANKKFIVKASIKNEDGEFLVVKRSLEEDLFPDMWDFPGGMMEENEMPDEAIRREVDEEIRVQVEEAAEMGKYELEEKGEPLEFIAFDVALAPGNVTISPEEYSEFKWASMAEILESKHTPFLDMYFSEFPGA